MAFVIVVEDDEIQSRAWYRVLVREGHVVHCTGTLADARKFLKEAKNEVDSVLLDIKLPDGNGLELLEEISGLNRKVSVAVVSGYVDAKCMLELRGKVSLVLPKPLKPTQLPEILRIITSNDLEALINSYAKDKKLSNQETKLLIAVAKSKEMHELATEVGCSESSIKTYLQRIFIKTGLRSRRDLMADIVRFAVIHRS